MVADAVGGTSRTAHEMALRRIEQAGGKMIGLTQMLCELQRDWQRKDTVESFMNIFIETGGTMASSSRMITINPSGVANIAAGGGFDKI